MRGRKSEWESEWRAREAEEREKREEREREREREREETRRVSWSLVITDQACTGSIPVRCTCTCTRYVRTLCTLVHVQCPVSPTSSKLKNTTSITFGQPENYAFAPSFRVLVLCLIPTKTVPCLNIIPTTQLRSLPCLSHPQYSSQLIKDTLCFVAGV